MTPQDLLRLHPFLGALTDAEVQALLKGARCRLVGSGEIVFLRNDPTDGLYGVLAGSVLIVVDSAEGKELVLNKHDAGEFFGEVSLLDGEGRSASAVAYEPSKLLHIGRDRLMGFFKQRPEAMLRIVELLCTRMRRVTHLVEDSLFLDVSTRLARQIVALAGAGGPQGDISATLHLSQNDLAPHAGRVARIREQAAHAVAGREDRRARPAPARRSVTARPSNGCETASAAACAGHPRSGNIWGRERVQITDAAMVTSFTSHHEVSTMRIFFVLSTFTAVTAVTAMTASMLIQAPVERADRGHLRCRRPFEGRAEARERARTPDVLKADSVGCPCGPVAYSVAEQEHVGLPWTSPTPKTEAGKASPCGPVAYSVADQNYASRPCTP